MGICLFIIGNGRKRYLERTIASWEANVSGNITHKIIFDDSGNAEYGLWLKEKFGKRYTIIQIDDQYSVGQTVAIQFIFDYIKNLDVEFILEIEEDWMLFRPLDLNKITSILAINSHIVQMRIPRTIWYSDYHTLDIDAGSLLLYHKNLEESTGKFVRYKRDRWFEWRGKFYFWSHNPSVFRKSIVYEDYFSYSIDHEYSFGEQLMNKSDSSCIGFWAINEYDAYVTHIGYRDEKMHDSLSEH